MITNGYCTLAELKEYIADEFVYQATTIAFVASTKKITDSAYGLKRFEQAFNDGALIKVDGTTHNDGYLSIVSISAGEIVVSDTLTDEVAGTLFTLSVHDVTKNDTTYENAINAASRAIEKFCNRKFYSTSETRLFDADEPNVLNVPDLLSVTSLKTDEDGDGVYETTWTTGDYQLMPMNANLDNKPYTWIRTRMNGNYTFPISVEGGVQIVGSFGNNALGSAPAEIKQACLILASRLAKRKDTPFGVAGTNQFGVMQFVSKVDSDVQNLLAPFIRRF